MTLQNNRGKRGARSKRKAQIFYFSCQKYQSNIVSNVMKMFQRLYIARLCCLSSYFAKHDVATKSKQTETANMIPSNIKTTAKEREFP